MTASEESGKLTNMRIGSRWVWVSLVVSLGPTQGCATLFSSSSQQIKIESNVEGAGVLLDGEVVGKTPLTIELDRDTFERHELLIRSEGYESQTVRVNKTLNKVALFNCTSVLSWGTDALTGAMMEYSPGAYFVELESSGSKAPKKGSDGEKDGFQERWSDASGPGQSLAAFVTINHAHVLSDIARRRGPHLDAALELAGVSHSRRTRVADVLAARLAAQQATPTALALVGYVRAAKAATLS